MLSQAPVCLERRKRCFSKAPWSLTITRSFASCNTYRYFFPSCLYPLTTRMWSAVENSLSPVTSPISSQLTHRKMLYFSFADVTGFCRTILDYFTGNLLRDPTTGGRVFGLPNKWQDKKVSCRKFSSPANACTISFVTHCKKIHYNWIVQASAA